MLHYPSSAIVADWLVTHGGAENVIDECCDLLPDAPIFTTVANRGALGSLDRRDIRTTRLQPFYRMLGRHEPLLPLMPRAIEQIDLRGYDLVISSSHAVAKGVITDAHAAHVCYCHTPMRYAWEMEQKYLDDFRIPRMLRPWVQRRLSALRRWDLSTAKRVDTFIANSQTTQERIRNYYGCDSVVLPPPVADHFFETAIDARASTDGYYLAVGRMVPYKRFDLLIEAANARGLQLKIAGKGLDEGRLRSLAGPTVEFLGRVDDDALGALYAGAKAFLFPQEEDAGIVLLEAHACGTPAIAFGKGGARDALLENTTGIFFDEQKPEALMTAITRCESIPFDRQKIREHAQQFRRENFQKRLKALFDEAMEKSQNTNLKKY